MSFFISDAWAEGASTGAGSGFASMVPLVLIFVIFYFLLLRPQIKRAKEQKQMMAALAKGDEVVTNGGLLGRITRADEDFVNLEIAPGVRVKLQKNAVAAMVPKGTVSHGGKGEKGDKPGKAAALPEKSAADEGEEKPVQEESH